MGTDPLQRYYLSCSSIVAQPELTSQRCQLRLDIMEITSRTGGAGDEDDIHPVTPVEVTCRFPQQAPGSIAGYRATHLPRGDHGHPRLTVILPVACVHHQQSPRTLCAQTNNGADVLWVGEAFDPAGGCGGHLSGAQLRPALPPPSLDDGPTTASVHACPETMLASTAAVVGLVRALHRRALPRSGAHSTAEAAS